MQSPITSALSFSAVVYVYYTKLQTVSSGASVALTLQVRMAAMLILTSQTGSTKMERYLVT